jgi:hypothetical protein
MNISSVSQPAQQLTAQQAIAAAAVTDDFFEDAGSQTGAASATGSTSTAATGSSTSVLSNQTLQALLDLTQSDPADQQNSATQGAQGTHHHHHHGGGGAQQPSTTSSTATTSDPTASIAELDSGSGSTTGDASDSLATALGA